MKGDDEMRKIKIGDIVYSINFEGFYTVKRIQVGLVYMEDCDGIKRVENIEEVRLVKE